MLNRRPIVLCVLLLLAVIPAAAEEILGLPLHIEDLGERTVRMWLGDLESTTAVAAIATSKGIVVIDTTDMPVVDAEYRKLIARELGRDDFRYLINTHGHTDHVAGNAVYSDCEIVAHESVLDDIRSRKDDIPRILEFYRGRLPELEKELAAAESDEGRAKLEEKILASKARFAALDAGIDWALPTVVFSDRMTLDLGDTTFELSYAGGVHSAGDIFVLVPERGLLFTGDVMADVWLTDSAGCLTSFDIRQEIPHDFPLLLDNWQRLVARKDEISHLVPGHWNGELSFAGFEARYLYVKTLWEGIAEAAAAGRSLDEVQASFSLAERFPELAESPGFSPQFHYVSVVSLWCEFTGTASAALALPSQIEEVGLAPALAACRATHSQGPRDVYFSEAEFNGVGYSFLGADRLEEAMAVFELNAELYPESWNVWDSLAEACLASGDHARARQLYLKSLELNPDNDNGRTMLERINGAAAESS